MFSVRFCEERLAGLKKKDLEDSSNFGGGYRLMLPTLHVH